MNGMPSASAKQPSAAESSRGYHRVAVFDDCERKYGFRYGMHLEAKRMAPAPALGSLLHIALMHHYRARAGRDAEDPIEAMQNAPARIVHQFAKALSIWESYLPWAAEADKAIEILDVEREFAARINGRLITTRLDLVVAMHIDREHRVIAIDHKSTSAPLAVEIRRQGDTGQLALEDAIGRAVLPSTYGLPYGGTWVNAISTTGADPVADRGPVHIEPEWSRAVRASLGIKLGRLEWVEMRPEWNLQAGVFNLPVSPDACKGRFANGQCDYFRLCREGPSVLFSARSGFEVHVDEVTEMREGSGV